MINNYEKYYKLGFVFNISIVLKLTIILCIPTYILYKV